MQTWETKIQEGAVIHAITIEEVAFDYELHIFEVFNGEEKLGSIVPATIEDMESIIRELNEGACPISDGWEDGMGNTCTLAGW